MAGIYIHVPFCRAKCVYCNFFSVATKKYQKEFTKAMVKEISTSDQGFKSQVINTLYIGGGTPSMLEKAMLQELMQALHSTFVVDATAEITLEANPDDIDEENLEFWKSIGINRLSIGVQSFSESDLHYLGRNHSANRALYAVKAAQSHGFENLSIDLIYGVPGQTIESLQENLQILVNLGITHISAYALTVETKTALDYQIRKKIRSEVDEEQAFQHFTLVRTVLLKHGFQHYEISNFAKDGAYSRHNTAYWNGIPYLGLGPSAHSYDGKARFWNLASLSKYLASSESGVFHREIEILSINDQYNEYVMTGLRTMWGCNSLEILQRFGQDVYMHFTLTANGKLNQKLDCNSGIYTVATEALFLTDGIISELMLPNE